MGTHLDSLDDDGLVVFNDEGLVNSGKALESSFLFNDSSEFLGFLDLEGGSDQEVVIENVSLGGKNDRSSGSDELSERSESFIELEEVRSGSVVKVDHISDQFVSENGVLGLDLVESFGEDGVVDLTFLVVEDVVVLFESGSLEESATEGKDITLSLVVDSLEVLLGNQSQDFGSEGGVLASDSSNQRVVVSGQAGVNELVVNGSDEDVLGLDVTVVDVVGLEVSQTRNEVFSDEEDFGVSEELAFSLGFLDSVLEGLFNVFNKDVESESGGAEAGFLLAVVTQNLDEGFVGVSSSSLAELQFLFKGRFRVNGDFLSEDLSLGVFFVTKSDLAISLVFEKLFNFESGFVVGKGDTLEFLVFLTLDNGLGSFLNLFLGLFLLFLDLFLSLSFSLVLNLFLKSFSFVSILGDLDGTFSFR